MIKIAVICRSHALPQVKAALKKTGAYEVVGFQLTNQLTFNIIDCFELVLQADALYIEGFPNMYLLVQHAVRNSKHIFMQRPRYLAQHECREILSLAREASNVIQVGSSHRYHRLLQDIVQFDLRPRHVDICHQIVPEQHELTDETLQEILLNDVEITLKIVRSPVRKLSVNAVRVGDERTGLVNARIEFDNGSVATIAADLLNDIKKHMTYLYQADAHLAIDFINNSLKFNTFAASGEPAEKQEAVPVVKEYPRENEGDMLKRQLVSFSHSINSGQVPLVSFDDIYQAMVVFNQIQEKISYSHE